MTSSQAYLSSPVTPRRSRRKSKFTYKQLATLASSSTTCPLRCIALIDLDAFYAQCETVRLGIDPSKPLAVQQWQGLIAINYPARAFGLSRHVTISEAKEKCPEIICQHVATWKAGDTKWSYELNGADAGREISSRKVSLDPYRIQSRKILALIKEFLPADRQKVEKASIDEVFLDLSAHVHSLLLERYPELRGPPPYDDPSEPLPRPPTTALDWAADSLVDLDSSQTEEDEPDWDDVCALIASEIVRDVRKAVFDQLHYTCSAGISKNKMLAKLGAGHHKPNGQTVIRNRAVQQFLSGFKFTKIRNLGGKLGDELVAAFNTDLVSEMLKVPLEQLKKQFGDDTGSWLYSTFRGEDTSEVNPRTQIKSMLSAKSFRPSINSFEVACKWLRIFVADIFSRLVEEGVLENKRRPKTINLHHRQGAQTRSKQSPIPMGRQITEDGLFELAKNLLAHVIVDGRAWPCANLSLSVGGFENGVTNNKGIGGFLVHGDEAKALRGGHGARDGSDRAQTPPSRKRRRTDEAGGITKFFGAPARQESTASDDLQGLEGDDMEANDADEEALFVGQDQPDDELYGASDTADLSEPTPHPDPSTHAEPVSSQSLIDEVYPAKPNTHNPPPAVHDQLYDTLQGSAETYLCPRCQHHLPLDAKLEHEDFHFAQDLQNEHSSSPRPPPPKPVPPAAMKSTSSGGGGGAGGGGAAKGKGKGRPPSTLAPERGQRRLAFG
ncbi:hypothetical protein BAUCODRAFT_36277 [Baudoinia panamericana UAMH 10762]|uniref:DNA polymerase eta n=1 Tax=Baudoinia panamericana (strain UAMH 10762) TaxID=717646 RepID=M2MQQ4_BAUPA|nr:uncharacterized protein BAUCODRAFT_36277 [Baudoinia panamericana UAMH 10762]EMC93818.1 hypothetical protein BAUCODRAFT_36277 [Baudoinia panamericana UAMH 10762]